MDRTIYERLGMKQIAFYLPQFHTIPENDEWWGKGFTEWVNVKKSEPLFKGHNQPEVPLQGYYDLSDVNEMVKQAKMAKEYGLYGFCYYHYWFQGKLLLEKPLEQMLQTPEVDIPFCLCWANEAWARTWDGSEKQVLMSQNYDENDEQLKSHFVYFLQFFKDARYIKEDNKPILVIYKPHLIQNIDYVLEFWNRLAIENGFDGMIFAYQHHSAFSFPEKIKGFDFGIEFEPWFTIDREEMLRKNIIQKIVKKIKQRPSIVDYDEVWKKILERTPNGKVCPGAFVSWDNSPRMGNRATVVNGATPEKFKQYYMKQVERARELYKSEYIFINAWNEWAEGAHLEPDEKNGYGYLEAIKNIKEKL